MTSPLGGESTDQRVRCEGTGRFRETVAYGLHRQTGVGDFPCAPTRGPAFPLAPTEPAEARLYTAACFAGGMAPEEPYLAEDLSAWLSANRHLLTNRKLIADIGLVWSPHSAAAYGRESSELPSLAPYRGILHALARGHHCYRPVRLADDLTQLPLVILPHVGAMSDTEIATVRRYVAGGGTLLATGETSLYDGAGAVREDYGLSEVFGASLRNRLPERLDALTTRALLSPMTVSPGDVGRLKGPAADHSYLRLDAQDHAVLAGFDGTEVIPFGGQLPHIQEDARRTVLMTFVPPFPSFPIDRAFPAVAKTDLAGLVVGSFGAGRVIFLPADLDRRFGIERHPAERCGRGAAAG
jgi:hypothetical protein